MHIFGEGTPICIVFSVFFKLEVSILKFGLIVAPLSQKGAVCADTVVGQGNTAAWKMCGLDRNTSLTVFFDVSPSERSSQPGHQNPHLYIQFVTRYLPFCCLWCKNGSIY
jgi:hypothetical protein